MEYCSMHRNGSEGYIRHTDIDETRVAIANEYQSPLDCMWIIKVAEGWKILLSFEEFELSKPNDCESNFVWVFKERTDIPSSLKRFCGAMADMAVSENNIMHVRYYADKSAFGSKFRALFTAFREGNKKGCEEDEYDCQDDTCISGALRCNGRVNCRFRWDEDVVECAVDKNRLADIIGADHIIIILVIFCLILSCMCFAFLYNCIKKLIHDHKIIREHLRQSRQSRLDEVGKTAPPLMSPRMTPSAVRSRANSSSAGGGGNPLLADSEHDDSSPHRSAPDDCYVPSAGDLLPILLQANHGTSVPPGVQPPAGVPANGDAVFLRDNHHHHHHHYGEDECDDLEMSTFPLPEMRDNECQTRESLFLNTNSDASMTPPPPPPPITPRYNSITTSESRSMPRPPQHNSSSNTSGFSTFGYGNRGGSATRGGKDFSTLPQQGHHHHHHHHHHAGSVTPGQPPPVPQAQFRAEAVIEMEQQQQQQRPFSVDSTKSAPDVIVTH
ncbi:uncharacterized protein [Anabrus simplex]|uniref:uncharacterized protein n=1 Tax=Anabrus simplex TaxID=316456 RepID=UPI0035A2AC51